MNVEQLMTSPVESCRETDMLNRAAQIMWERDCGVVPVVDASGKPIAMITDRDICNAAYTQGLPLSAMTVSSAMSKRLVACNKGEPIKTAESLMRSQQVRRLPIVGDAGELVGILSLNDIATREHVKDKHGVHRDEFGADAIARTLSAICARPGVQASAE